MRKRLVLALGAFAGLTVCAGGALASPATTHYSTYLRSGPGEAYPVLDEVEHDTRLDVGPCKAGWCAVSEGGVTGYVDADALTLARPIAGAAPRTSNGCFTTSTSTYGNPGPRQFCEAAKAAPSGSP